jgi:hypothetical protein
MTARNKLQAPPTCQWREVHTVRGIKTRVGTIAEAFLVADTLG